MPYPLVTVRVCIENTGIPLFWSEHFYTDPSCHAINCIYLNVMTNQRQVPCKVAENTDSPVPQMTADASALIKPLYYNYERVFYS